MNAEKMIDMDIKSTIKTAVDYLEKLNIGEYILAKKRGRLFIGIDYTWEDVPLDEQLTQCHVNLLIRNSIHSLLNKIENRLNCEVVIDE
tara:strand:+ start:1682 stop:1948 length:267 start_codon:yes stop_codon:yes gene_type:complete